jgi:hypothetical protein
MSVPRRLMWTSWIIQPGQSLTSRPECRKHDSTVAATLYLHVVPQ